MSRIKAFLIHLGISILIFLIILYFILFHWYPDFLFATDGGWQGIRIIAAVDLVLGPLLTLIVFKPGKPSLKMDMSIIAVIQASALTWGVWLTWYQHPYALIFYENYFEPVAKHYLEKANVPISKIDALSGDAKPRLIYVNLPYDDYNKIQVIRSEAQRTKTPLYLRYEYYDSFDSKYIPSMQAESLDLEKILKKETDLEEKISQKMRYYADHKEEYMFFMIDTRKRRMTAVVNKEDLKITDIIDFNPTSYLYFIQFTK